MAWLETSPGEWHDDAHFYWVRRCRGHFHVTTDEYDIGDAYRTVTDAQDAADQMNREAILDLPTPDL